MNGTGQSRRHFIGGAVVGTLGSALVLADNPSARAVGASPRADDDVIDVPSLWQEGNGTVPDPSGPGVVRKLGPALMRALRVLESSSRTAVLAFPSGVHVLPSFALDRPVRLTSLGPPTARFGTTVPSGDTVYRGAMLWWDGVGDAPFVRVASNGVEVDGVGFYGGNREGTAVHVEYGYELGMRRVRMSSWRGTALRIDHTGNSTFDQVFIESCGTAEAPAVDINSKPPSGVEANVRTNTVDFRGLTVEQSRGTALRIGVDPARNDAAHAQLPSFLRFTDLHIESIPTDDSSEFAPHAPAVHVGTAVSVSLLAPFIYAGPDALIRHEEPVARPSTSEGLYIVGGTLLGRAATTLVDLVGGDGFSMSAVRLRGVVPGGNAVVLGPRYRGAARIDAATFFYIGSDGGIDDRRTVPLSPFRIHGRTVLGGGIRSTAPSALAASTTPGSTRAELLGADELRGTIRITTAAHPAPGDLATVVLSVGSSPEGVVVVSATDPVSASASPCGRLGSDRYGRMTIVIGAATPAPNTQLVLHYMVIS